MSDTKIAKLAKKHGLNREERKSLQMLIACHLGEISWSRYRDNPKSTAELRKEAEEELEIIAEQSKKALDNASKATLKAFTEYIQNDIEEMQASGLES